MYELLDLFVGTVLPRVTVIAVLIGAGVGLATLAVEFGAVTYIVRFSAPITDPANLPEEVGTAILATATSTTAGYGMLAEYRDAGLLDDRATLVAVTINTFFGFLQHVITYYVPVLIPILGATVGTAYVGIRAGIALGITLVGILAGALVLSPDNVDPSATTPEQEVGGGDRTRRERIHRAGERTWAKTKDIVPRLVIIYTLVVFALEYYDPADYLGPVEPITGLLGLPPESVAVIAVVTVDLTAGAITLAPMLDEPFTPTAALITLLLGSAVSFTVSTFKRSIPFQYGIWGAEFGTKVIIVNTTLKLVFIIASIGLLLVL